jgi:hypothetical protein
MGLPRWPAGHKRKPMFLRVCSCCDYPPPVCGSGSGHIGQGRKIEGTHRPSTKVLFGWKEGRDVVADVRKGGGGEDSAWFCVKR